MVNRMEWARLLVKIGGTSIGARWSEAKGRPSGFDYLRIVLSLMVLLWHSYPVSYGLQSAYDIWNTPIGWLLQTVLPSFFALSGFLVSDSMARNASLPKFIGLRIIRIFPALCIEVVISAIVLGPLVTQITLNDYFIDTQFHAYLLNIFGIIHYKLPGVFLNNPVPGIVNGNLWTVPFELECYILISILWLSNCFSNKYFLAASFALISICVLILNVYKGISGASPGALNGRVLVLCFFSGVVVFQFKHYIIHNILVFVMSLSLFMIFNRGYYSVYFCPIFITYATVYIGVLDPDRNRVLRSGDYSYGIYLYAAPVQQTTAFLLGGKNTWLLNLSCSLPIACLLAYLSWHFVEKPALRLKRFLPNRSMSILKRSEFKRTL